MISSRKNAYIARTNRLAYGEDPDSFVYPRSFSGNLFRQQCISAEREKRELY